MPSNLMKTYGCDAAALRAIRISSELTRADSRLQVGGNRVGGPGKNAFIGIRRRVQKTFNDCRRHIELLIHLAEFEQIFDDLPPRSRRQDLVAGLADLGGKQAHPDLFNLRAFGPELHKFGEVTGPLRHLTCDRAVDRDFAAIDTFQNAIVCRRSAAFVMFRSQTIDGDNDLYIFQSLPLARDFPDGAGYDVGANVPFVELRQDLIQFPESDERFTAHE